MPAYDIQRDFSTLGKPVCVSAPLEKQLNHLFLAVCHSMMKRGPTIDVTGIEVSASSDE